MPDVASYAVFMERQINLPTFKYVNLGTNSLNLSLNHPF